MDSYKLCTVSTWNRRTTRAPGPPSCWPPSVAPCCGCGRASGRGWPWHCVAAGSGAVPGSRAGRLGRGRLVRGRQASARQQGSPVSSCSEASKEVDKCNPASSSCYLGGVKAGLRPGVTCRLPAGLLLLPGRDCFRSVVDNRRFTSFSTLRKLSGQNTIQPSPYQYLARQRQTTTPAWYMILYEWFVPCLASWAAMPLQWSELRLPRESRDCVHCEDFSCATEGNIVTEGDTTANTRHLIVIHMLLCIVQFVLQPIF